MVPHQATDVVVAATVSNWGAYGIAAALAVLLQRPDVLHTPQMEEDILRACAREGLIDGVSGQVAPSADGLGPTRAQGRGDTAARGDRCGRERRRLDLSGESVMTMDASRPAARRRDVPRR